MRGRRQSAQVTESPLPEDFNPCPITTPNKTLPGEKEIKAYKLGKRRWSYNQCALEVKHPQTGQTVEVVDCMQYGTTTLNEQEQESGVTYQVRLKNGIRVRINIFAVYDFPRETTNEVGEVSYEWPTISRKACPKHHCEGAILRTIQRFGKLGRRSGQNSSDPDGRNGNAMKDAKYMFISIDEAGSHVRVKHFRLIAGMYGNNDTGCLGTAISGPIRVLANNDVPTGAAYIPLNITADDRWEGWKDSSDFKARLPECMKLPSTHIENSRSSNESDYGYGDGLGTQLLKISQNPPLPGILRAHAAVWSQDRDQGASRMNSALQQYYNGDCATSPQDMRGPRYLTTEEEAPSLQASRMDAGLSVHSMQIPMRDENMLIMPSQEGFMGTHNGMQTQGSNQACYPSNMSDYSPELSAFVVPDMRLSPPEPHHQNMPYLTFPQYQQTIYNPFSHVQGPGFSPPGPLDGDNNWVDEELLTGDHAGL